VQEELRQGSNAIWRPLLWEGTSCLVATLIVAIQWRFALRTDPLLIRPWRWFAAHLAWLPVAAPAFVAAVYGSRHAAYAVAGATYRHWPWGQVFVYESLKFAIFYLLFTAVFFGIRTYAVMVAERVRAERAAALANEAQLLQLAQQIEPHFLFNALNTIAETVHRDPDLADALITRLAALLRAATDLTRRPEATLGEELALLQGYAAIMCERFAGRASVDFDIPEPLRACRVPALALQPLLENAFRHGVEKQAGPVHVRIGARREGGRLIIAVENDAGTLDPARGDGTGLGNLRRRLATRYGDAASLGLAERAGGGVVATIELPCGC
jgi:LytS/YehU family sensor histidine kinase